MVQPRVEHLHTEEHGAVVGPQCFNYFHEAAKSEIGALPSSDFSKGSSRTFGGLNMGEVNPFKYSDLNSNNKLYGSDEGAEHLRLREQE